MAALQRSAVSFRRQGSSGVIWEDRFYSGNLNLMKHRQEAIKEFGELRKCQSDGSTTVRMERNRPNGAQLNRPCKALTAIEPPSPKPSGCCFFHFSRKPMSIPHSKPGNKKA